MARQHRPAPHPVGGPYDDSRNLVGIPDALACRDQGVVGPPTRGFSGSSSVDILSFLLQRSYDRGNMRGKCGYDAAVLEKISLISYGIALPSNTCSYFYTNRICGVNDVTYAGVSHILTRNIRIMTV